MVDSYLKLENSTSVRRAGAQLGAGVPSQKEIKGFSGTISPPSKKLFVWLPPCSRFCRLSCVLDK